MRGELNGFDKRFFPSAGLDEAIVSDSMIKDQSVVDIEEARGISFGSCGFNDNVRDRHGTAESALYFSY